MAVVVGHPDERGVDVLGHPARVAADVDVGAVLEPAKQLSGLLEHAVLHVDLFGLVAGKGCGQARERAAGLPGLDLVAVDEIAIRALVAEKQPVAAPGAGCDPFLDEGAEGRYCFWVIIRRLSSLST